MIAADTDTLAEEIISQAEQNIKIRNRKHNHQNTNNCWTKNSSGSQQGIVNASGHNEMHAEAHISEILDSDNNLNDSIQEESSSEEMPLKQRGDIWTQADFWNKPVSKPVSKPKPKPKPEKPVEP